ncbi:MAG: hypothetical protein WAN82_00795 [Candidatus Bathyarchaeia archaeon]|jgi:hypothetical protein
MSEEGGGFGITLAEKFFGFIIIIIGAMATYYTFTSTSALGDFTGFFGVLSIFLLAVGVFLIIAKTE